MSKTCTKCNQTFELENFRTNGKKPDGSVKYHSWCLGCFKLNSKIPSAKRQMEIRELPFELDNDEFINICFEECTYCGEIPTREHPGSVDRIDSKEGYTQTNVTPSCDWCNKMKNDYDVNEFKQKINKIANHNTHLTKIINIQLIVIGVLFTLNFLS